MKKLYKLVLKAFLGPFVLTFFIAIFILLMQFLWKYIDDLVGKGLDLFVITKLLFFASASIVPMALPLAMLLSSIMTFGNLSEHYELVALKSAGISLKKIMAPIVVVSIFISIGAFYFSNYALPYSNLKMGSLLWDIRNSNPAFNLKEGVFDNSIQNFSIRVDKKLKDKNLEHVMIYNHLERDGNSEVILADKGLMQMTDGTKTLLLTLNDGSSYNEPLKTANDQQKAPLLRSTFKHKIIRFDLSQLGLSRTDEDLFKDNYHMLNLTQLVNREDTLNIEYNSQVASFKDQMAETYPKIDTAILTTNTFNTANFLSQFPASQKSFIVNSASSLIRSNKSLCTAVIENFNFQKITIRKHGIEWHRKFTLSFACLILLFIGAPLGALIKKGGLGMPVVVSMLLFIIFHVISISGEKAAKVGEMGIFSGMWLASFCFLPLGIFLTYRAANDKPIISSLFISKIYSLFKK